MRKNESRSGVKSKRHITASKGGRIERFYARITPADKASITAMLAALSLTSGDWLARVAAEWRERNETSAVEIPQKGEIKMTAKKYN